MGDDRAGVSVAEAAAALGITPEAVRKRLGRGTLTGSRVGRTWRVHLASVDGHTSEPGGQEPHVGGRASADRQPDAGGQLAELERCRALLEAVTGERDYLRSALAAALGTQQLLAERAATTATETTRPSWWARLWRR